MSTITDQVGNVTAFAYEPVTGRLASITYPDGRITEFGYDTFGEVTRITDPEGGTRLFTHTPEGKLATRTDENGNLTSFAYGADQNLETITYADGSVTQMTYDSSGNTTMIAEAAGTALERQIQRSYDDLNRVLTVEVTGADGAQIDGVTQYAYLPAGNLASVTDETGLVTSMGYDPLERLVAIDDPAEGLISRSYNDAGEVVSHTNGDGETHLYGYDDVSRLTQVTDPEGFVKSFAYDTRDNITSVTDGRGGTTVFAYDSRDRMLTRTNPLGLSMSRAYDPRDNLITLTREDGVTETASYDGLGRRTQVVTPDNTLTYAFDARGNLTEAADDDSRVTFEYDSRNRLAASITDGTVGPQPGVRIDYAYDLLDRRVSMTDSLGGVTGFTYDAEDRLTDLTAPWGTVYSFGYNGEGRRTSLTSTSGRDTRYEYANGLLSALRHAQNGVALTDLRYDYGPDGQLTAILDALDPSKSKFVSYDSLNRLVQVAEGVPPVDGGVPIPVEDYAYDEEGNRTASHLSAFYASNDHNQLLEDDRFTYAYDARGNRVSKTAKGSGEVETYQYDSQNRLIGYTSPTTTASYAYDALDRRIAKNVDGAGEAFVYDGSIDFPLGLNDIILKFDDGDLVQRWLHELHADAPIASETYNGSPIPGGGLAEDVFLGRDGSVIAVVGSATGLLTSRSRYEAFGYLNDVQGSGPVFGFTAREDDAESGLIHFRARSLDPKTGRFMQSDPLSFEAGTFNLYGYVDNNPFNFKDPSGLIKKAFGGRHPEMTLQNWAQAELREAAIEAVAEGIFRGIGDALGNMAYAQRLVEEAAEAAKKKKQKDHNHHCFPKYLGGTDHKTNRSMINAGKHRMLHKAMRLYLREYDLDYAAGYKGTFILRRFKGGGPAMRAISSQFYQDMKERFGVDFGC